MEWLAEWLRATWDVTAEMAPYLLLGFLIAGVLSIFLTREIVERHLGGRGWWTSLKATLIGIPLPLCSCGVIPVAASLHKQGAGRGAIASFLTSTPQTGVDSILATYALMGLPFTIAKVLAALVTGFVAGLVVDRTKAPPTSETEALKASCCSSEARSPEPSCCSVEAPCETSPPEPAGCCDAPVEPEKTGRIAEALRYGFITLPKEIGRSLVVGLILAGLITTLIPEGFFGGWLAHPFIALIAVTLVAVPMYVCATGSIPLAFALMEAGMAPGAALVFLIAGPATNAVTINTVRQLLGRQAAALYVVTLVLCAWVAGAVFTFGGPETASAAGPHLHAADITIGHGVAAVVLIALLTPPLLPERKGRTNAHHH